MTQSTPTPGQEPSRRPEPATEPTMHEPPAPSAGASGEGAAAPAVAEPDVLDDGTYAELRRPRGEGRLDLDGRWHQISPKYVVSQTVQNAIFVVIVVIAGVVAQLIWSRPWVWIPVGAIVLITLIVQIILPRQARALGYMLRGDDLVFRKGILWQRMVAVPYGRMQLVDITHGPMDRAFGIAKLKMITAAATTGVEIPGLSQTAAEALRDTLIEVAETRRTGL
ncbi:MAG: PH domain-containing protein [Microbacterium sp.]